MNVLKNEMEQKQAKCKRKFSAKPTTKEWEHV